MEGIFMWVTTLFMGVLASIWTQKNWLNASIKLVMLGIPEKDVQQ